MLRDLVKALFADRHEVEFVAEVDGLDDVLPALVETEANVVLVAVREGTLTVALSPLLDAPRHVRVLTRRDVGRTGGRDRIDAVRASVEELSAETLLGAMG